MKRVVLVGMCPNATGRVLPAPFYALTGATGRRIAELAGLRWWDYLYRTERVNLLPEWPGEVWPRWYARRQAEIMAPRLGGRCVVLLGRAVADAFACPWDPLCWRTIGDGLRSFQAVVMPHPSGRNRWYNDEANRRRAEEVLREVFA